MVEEQKSSFCPKNQDIPRFTWFTWSHLNLSLNSLYLYTMSWEKSIFSWGRDHKRVVLEDMHKTGICLDDIQLTNKMSTPSDNFKNHIDRGMPFIFYEAHYTSFQFCQRSAKNNSWKLIQSLKRPLLQAPGCMHAYFEGFITHLIHIKFNKILCKKTETCKQYWFILMII